MRNAIPKCLFSLVGFLALGAVSSPQDIGAIRGTVVDENLIPVFGAKVNAEALDSRPTGSLVRYVESDSKGHFVIDRLGPGKYRVFASKEEAGYPDLGWSFYSNDVFQTAAVTSADPTAEVRIQLGPRAGVITGFVSDAATGAPVPAAFKLSRAGQPNKWISPSVAPKYRLLVPSAIYIVIEVSAPGFKTWSLGHSLRLQSGSEMRLDVSLEPDRNPNLHRSRFLVPDGYSGWLELEYGVKDGAAPITEDGIRVFKFPASGLLKASGPGPEPGAEDDFEYFSEIGSQRQIPIDYALGKGMVWGKYQGFKAGVPSLYGFFVGTEEQYKRHQSEAAHPGPIPTQ